MMYRVKRIIVHEDNIALPNCMYYLKRINNFEDTDEGFITDNFDINVSNQAPNKKMAELEQRQTQLLKKLDILYDRIKTISSYCSVNNLPENKNRYSNKNIPTSEEIVLVLSPDNLPWFLNIILKETSLAVNVSWHIHSSVPNEKMPKIKAFVKNIKSTAHTSNVNLRLIFKCVSADTELKLSSLAVPIVGNVNILRYLSFVYPTVVYYDYEDYNVDYILDLCHQLERTLDKDKEALIKKIFLQYKVWIYKNQFSIIDLAVYNAIKQSRNGVKYVPKDWFERCEKLLVV